MAERRIMKIGRWPHIDGEYVFYDDGTYRFSGIAADGFAAEYSATYTMMDEEREMAKRSHVSSEFSPGWDLLPLVEMTEREIDAVFAWVLLDYLESSWRIRGC